MIEDDRPEDADWERRVLERMRERVEVAEEAPAAHAGWETVALQRLRAHLDEADDAAE